MKLTNQNIDDVMTKIQALFDSTKLSKKDKIRVRLLIEEALLRFQEKFGEDQDFDFVTKKWFGTPKILIRLKEKPYDPLKDNDNQIFSLNIMNNLLDYEKAHVIYRYENGYNEIVASSTKNIRDFKIPGGAITTLIFSSILTAYLISNLPQAAQDAIVFDIVTPILNTLLGTLIAVCLPLTFVSIIASIFTMENVAMLNDLGSKILKRFLAIMFFTAFISIFICNFFFPVINFDLGGDSSLGGAQILKPLFDMLLSMFPQGIFEPFIEKNILQVLVMAFIIGVCVVILGDSASTFKNLIINFRQIMFKVIWIVFRIIPLVIYLFLVKTMLLYSAAEILDVWKVIAVKYVLFSALTLAMLLRNSIKYNVKILDFLKKISPPVMISLKTAGGIASLQKNLEVCKKDLKIDERLVDFHINLSQTLCSTTIVVNIVVNIFFAAEFSGQTISLAEVFIVAFLAVQFTMSAVGGNGGMVAMLSLILTQLGFSLDAIGAVTVADIFTIHYAVVSSLIIRDCDLIDFAHSVKK